MTLRDPDVCRCGSHDTRLVKRRRGQSVIRRRHECRRCGHRWTSYQSLINPRRVTLKQSGAMR